MAASLDKIFEALASGPRRQILAYLTKKELSTTELAERFAMSTPAVSRHLSVLENAGLAKRLGPERLFPEGTAVWSSTMQAVERAYELLGDARCETCPVKNHGPVTTRNWSYVI